MSDQSLMLPCPHCRQPTDSLKSYRLPQLFLCLWIAFSVRHDQVTACPTCMRKTLLKRTLINILPANIVWPFVIVPWMGIAGLMTLTHGHSSSVYKRLGMERPR